jgi:outer membrane protein assembly factor BamD (BamD/ComL family)
MKKIIILIVFLFISIHIFAEEGKIDFLSNSSVVIIDTKINSTTVNIINNPEIPEKEKNHKVFYKAEESFKNGDYIKAKELYLKHLSQIKNKKLQEYIISKIQECDDDIDINKLDSENKNLSKIGLYNKGKKLLKLKKYKEALITFDALENNGDLYSKKHAIIGKLYIYYEQKNWIEYKNLIDKYRKLNIKPISGDEYENK